MQGLREVIPAEELVILYRDRISILPGAVMIKLFSQIGNKFQVIIDWRNPTFKEYVNDLQRYQGGRS